MADEIYQGSGNGADLLVAEVTRREALLSLGSRASLRNHPVLIQLGDDLIGSNTLHGNLFGLDGADLMAATAEGAAVANTALTEAEYTVSPARYGLAYEFSDWMNAVDPYSVVNSMRLAMSIVRSAGMTLTNLIAQDIDGFTQVGTTGTPMTHDTFLAAQFALEQALVPGPYLTVLKPKQYTDWQSDLESRGGLTQWRPASAEQQALRGEGFKGFYNGIEICTSNQVQGLNSNADWGGGMFGRGAIGYKELAMKPAPRSSFVIVDLNGVIRVAEVRTEREGETAVVGHYYVGTTVIEAGRGRTIVSSQ